MLPPSSSEDGMGPTCKGSSLFPLSVSKVPLPEISTPHSLLSYSFAISVCLTRVISKLLRVRTY